MIILIIHFLDKNYFKEPLVLNQDIYFIVELKKSFPSQSILRYDERYTSKISSKIILESRIKKNKRKNKRLIDKISATLILQSFLEYNSKNT